MRPSSGKPPSPAQVGLLFRLSVMEEVWSWGEPSNLHASLGPQCLQTRLGAHIMGLPLLTPPLPLHLPSQGRNIQKINVWSSPKLCPLGRMAFGFCFSFSPHCNCTRERARIHPWVMISLCPKLKRPPCCEIKI